MLLKVASLFFSFTKTKHTNIHITESPCTSDDILSSSTDNLRNLPSTSSSHPVNINSSSATVQSRDTKFTSNERYADNSSDDGGIDFNTNTVPVPSTSTGITSNGQLFRLAQSNADSDDDPSPENSPRAIPVPINGSHHSFNANNYSSGIDDERPNRYNNRRKTNISLNRIQNNYGHYSSHSNSRLSSSCSDDDDASSNDSLLPFFDNKKRKLSENGNADVVVDEQHALATSSTTPHPSWMNFTPDSGISAVGSSSASSSAPPSTSQHDGNNNGTGMRSNSDSSVKLFQQKIARVRRNYRNNFGDDSDSD